MCEWQKQTFVSAFTEQAHRIMLLFCLDRHSPLTATLLDHSPGRYPNTDMTTYSDSPTMVDASPIISKQEDIFRLHLARFLELSRSTGSPYYRQLEELLGDFNRPHDNGQARNCSTCCSMTYRATRLWDPATCPSKDLELWSMLQPR